MPGLVESQNASSSLLGRRAEVEQEIGCSINDDIWIRMVDAEANYATVTRDSIGLKEWKDRNRKLKKLLKSNPETHIADKRDKRVLRFALAIHGDSTQNRRKALSLMQKEIHADEKSAKRSKASSDVSDQPVDEQAQAQFCWIDYPYPQTAAICAFADIFEDAGWEVKLTNTRDRHDFPEGLVNPTAFERFCFKFLFGLTIDEVRADTSDTSLKEGSFKYLQRIPDALKHRLKFFPKK